VEGSRAGNRLESRKVQARANIGAVFPGDVWSSGDGLPGGHGGREVPMPLSRVEQSRV
jgi:hypothetical protein